MSEGEKQLLLGADIGEGIFFAGRNHVAMQIIASAEEHKLITSNPEELLQMKKDEIKQKIVNIPITKPEAKPVPEKPISTPREPSKTKDIFVNPNNNSSNNQTGE